MSKRTVEALMARGFDSEKASKLVSFGYTLSRLKRQKTEKLKTIGLSDIEIQIIQEEPRPPIPKNVLFEILHKHRRTCCVCRDPNQPIIVHHIEEWAKSRSHEEENLAVLCLNHHDLAHTKKGLSLSLPAEEIRRHKSDWQSKVETMDARAILGLKNEDFGARWDWINIRRLFDIVLKKNVEFMDIKTYAYLVAQGVVDQMGVLRDPKYWQISVRPDYWFLDFADGIYVSYYLDQILERIIVDLPITDITNYLNKEELRVIVKPGKYIAAQLGFYFRSDEKFEKGKTQVKQAYYKKHGVKIEFVFDAWYCTSSSARFDSMTGHKVKTVIGLVTSVTETNGTLNINMSCLAAGSYFERIRENAV